MKTIPDWRLAAGAGQSLAQAKEATVGAVKPQVPAPGSVPQGNSAMGQVILPSVRDRWQSAQLHYFTPQYVENICRGAMSGNLLGRWLLFDLMEQTWPRLVGNLNTLKDAVIDLDWNLQPFALRGEKPSPEAQRRAKKCDQAIAVMRPETEADERDFDELLYDVMDGVGKGIAVSEILWMPPNDPENWVGLWVPRATRWVHPRYYGYPSEPGMEDRLMLNLQEIQLANPNGWNQSIAQSPVATPGWNESSLGNLYARFPRDQFVISIFKQHSGHPINGALLRLLGFWWAASNFSWEWFLNLAQIFGVPLRWCNYAVGTGQAGTIAAIKEMMANLGSAGWAAFPEGTQVHIEKAIEAARDNPSKAFIDAADTIADILILGQTLTTTQGERGSQALGAIHKNVRDEKIQAVAKRTAKILNRSFLPALCRLNFGDDRECPWFQPSTKKIQDAVATATRYKTLLSIPGLKVSKQQFYQENDLVIPDEKDEVIVGQAGGGAGGPPAGDGQNGENDPMPGGDPATGKAAHQHPVARAKDATEKLTENVLEELTGVEAKWLAGVKPYFRRLVAAAKSGNVSDAEFVRTLEQAKKEMPELFTRLNHEAIARALEAAMGSAAVNGAVQGYLERGGTGR